MGVPRNFEGEPDEIGAVVSRDKSAELGTFGDRNRHERASRPRKRINSPVNIVHGTLRDDPEQLSIQSRLAIDPEPIRHPAQLGSPRSIEAETPSPTVDIRGALLPEPMSDLYGLRTNQ